MSTYLFYRPQADLLLTLGDAQAIFPDVRPNTDDATLASMGLHRLASDAEPPPVGRYEMLAEDSPDLVDGRYVRRYRVFPLFPGPVERWDGTVLTVEQQMARYDAGQLAEAKAAALARVEAGLADALAAGLHLGDGVMVDLDDGAALLRHEVSQAYFGADQMPLFVRGGGVRMLDDATFFGASADAARRRVALHLRRAELRARIEAAQTEDELQRLDLSVSAGRA
jgi:hypothetical protein